MATHVFQIVFLGDSGFHFPVAYFGTTEAVAGEIYIIMWEAVRRLLKHGFKV